MGNKIVVIGGVAAGAGAAAKARRADESAEIIIFERGQYVSFANCGLPYYIGGVIKDRDNLLLVTPERFKERYNIDVRIYNEVTNINKDKKIVSVKNVITGDEYEESYDKLVIATGGSPLKPPIEGSELPNIYTLWTVPDADEIKAYVNSQNIKNVSVIGGGFIGIEMVEAFVHIGLKVTLIELANQVLPPFDEEMTIPLAKHLQQKGVELVLGDGVKSFIGKDKIEEIELNSGKKLASDLVIMSIGVRPEIKLAMDAGLAIGETKGIIVDEYMRTSNEDIYAAGDIIECKHLVSGKMVRIPLAGPANKQGRVAGNNAAGGKMTFKGVLGTAIVKVLDLTAAKTGLSEKEAKALGYDYFVSYTHNQHHAGYYPGAKMMSIKLIADRKDGRVLGGQIIGPEGVDKRIDVLATALYGQMNVEDLENLDLSYAPPFASAKDPIIMAGMVAANIYRGEVKAISVIEMRDKFAKGEIQLIDVRTPEEFSKGSVSGSINIPLDTIRGREDEINKEKPTAIMCGVGYRSYTAYNILKDKGFKDLINVSGGFKCVVDHLPQK